MSRVLIIAEHDGAALSPSVAKTVACAAEIGDAEIDILVLAESAGDVATADGPASIAGTDLVGVVDHVCKARAAAFFRADPKSRTMAAPGELA